MGNVCCLGSPHAASSSSHGAGTGAHQHPTSSLDRVHNQFDGGGLYISNRNWDKKFPAITPEELRRRREEFWDTRVDGRAESWQALRLAIEADDTATRQAIHVSAGLTEFDSEKSDSCFCYDGLGNRYDVPYFVIYNPRNLLDSQPNGHQGDASSRSNLHASVDDEDESDELKASPSVSVTVRLASGKDIKCTLKMASLISRLKTQIAREQSLPSEDAPKIRVILRGKILQDLQSLSQCGIEDGTLVQAMLPRR